MTTALRAACIHQTTEDSHEIRREKTSSLRKTPSTWKTSMHAETMTMYYAVSTRGNGIAIRRGNRISLPKRDTRSKEETRFKTETWIFTKRKIQKHHLIKKKEKDRTERQSKNKRKNIRTLVPSLQEDVLSIIIISIHVFQ